MVEPSWVGRRVSVRRVVERAPDGRLLFGDVVGDLVGLDAQTAVVESRRGLVEIPLELIALAKPVVASTAEELELERLAARGIRAAETEQLGGWVLRADHGFLRRANSVLPLGQPGMPLDEALARAHDWYAARGLPLRIAVPTEARRLLDAELGERWWPIETPAHLMTGRLDHLVAPAAEVTDVAVEAAPDDAWFALYRDGDSGGEAGRALLTRHDRAVFASVREGGHTVAIGRGSVDDGWLGVAGVEVAPDARRRGLATAVTAALWAWGRDQGATRSYLQVEADNESALALYARQGYRVHHDYRYRIEPSGEAESPAP
ncbi:GNAT family N-acetyltransferase [uncultured Jatrophihabitans sp.]|uniref:GNAT family N-acetyltransferase n=1 Tax=uncultured Jatrophihabitans sp. TaxID=1610747 RepID=UPI0035C99492